MSNISTILYLNKYPTIYRCWILNRTNKKLQQREQEVFRKVFDRELKVGIPKRGEKGYADKKDLEIINKAILEAEQEINKEIPLEKYLAMSWSEFRIKYLLPERNQNE